MKAQVVNPSPVVLEVHDLHEEIRAGLGPATVSVRTLDGVSLSVHAGELVVLQGGVASGAASLFDALCGVGRRRTGQRRVKVGVQVRRASIPHAAYLSIANAWHSSAVERVTTGERTPVVYVFRVRDGRAKVASIESARDSRLMREAWVAWTLALRARGGSVVVQLPTGAPVGALSRASAAQYRAPRRNVHHHTGAVRESPHADAVRRASATDVRTVTLAGGRIIHTEG